MDTTTSRLNDRFEILRTLTEDGPTRTYLALDTQTGNEVTLKELNIGKAFDWKSIELFERESKTLQNLDHPAIPTYIDAFRTHDDTRFALAQNHIQGETLESILNNNNTSFDETQIRDLLDQILDLLTYLHEFSPPVIHRNICPTNILRDTHGRFHLLNFASVQTIVQDQIGGSTIVGTTGYMPPEQLLGRAQPATDLYALAATCIHLATGKHPADLPTERLKIQFHDHLTLSNPLSEHLRNILDKMLEPDSSQRFSTPKQVQNALLQTPTSQISPSPTTPPD